MTPKAINNAKGKRNNQRSHDLCMTHWAPSPVIMFTLLRKVEAMSHEQNPQNS